MVTSVWLSNLPWRQFQVICLFLFSLIQHIGCQPNSVDVCLRHADNNYAYGVLDDIVYLGPQNGLLAITGKRMSCLNTIDVYNLPGLADPLCSSMIEWVKNNSILESGVLRFALAIGNKFYWTVENSDIIKSKELPSKFGIFNSRFNVKQMDVWLDKYLKDYRIATVGLLNQGYKTPQYPTALVVMEDPFKVRDLFLYKTEPTDYNKMEKSKISIARLNISSIYIPDTIYADKKKLVIIYEKYYAEITANFVDQTLSKPFPVVPLQQLFGCPTNLCWWPLVDDIMYHEEIYYIFHGRWMWKFAEGQQNSPDVSLTIHLTMLEHHIKAAYYDQHFNKSMLIYYNEDKTYYLEEFDMVTQNIIKRNTKIGKIDPGFRITTGTYIDGELCMLATKKDQAYLMRFKYNPEQDAYMWLKRDPIPFHSVSAMFINKANGYLYLVSGFFIYIYESGGAGANLRESRCTVTYAAKYFNCSDNYYKKMELYSSFRSYSSDVEAHHPGKLLPDRCVIVRTWSKVASNKIPFFNKAPSDDHTNKPIQTLIIGLLIGMAVIAILLFFCIFYCTVCRKKRRRQVSDHRRNQNFNKFMPGVKERWRELMRKDNVNSTVAQSSYVSQSSSTSATKTTTTATARRKKNNQRSTITSTVNRGAGSVCGDVSQSNAGGRSNLGRNGGGGATSVNSVSNSNQNQDKKRNQSMPRSKLPKNNSKPKLVNSRLINRKPQSSTTDSPFK